MKRAFWGPDAKAWFANGLDEIRQLFSPGVQRIEPGPLPTYFTPTHGEITREKMEQRGSPHPEPDLER